MASHVDFQGGTEREDRQDTIASSKIVRGKIKKDLRKYITAGDLIGRRARSTVSIPLPQIQLPRFRYGDPAAEGGVGQGEGEEGDQLARGASPARAEAGDKPASTSLEVDVSLEELAEILGEELELPNIQPKGKKASSRPRRTYTGIHGAVGPESLRHFKRTFKQALKRQIASGTYDPDNPIVRAGARGQALPHLEDPVERRRETNA